MTLSARSMPVGWYWNGCRTRTTPLGRGRVLVAARRAARFQVFAAAVDTDLVFDEDVETIRHFALGGQDLCPEAATLVSHLGRDWAWVEAMAPREVLFGGLHFGNAAFRSPPPWPFEPAYLEVLCNGSGGLRAG
jgi:hypothetical protein